MFNESEEARIDIEVCDFSGHVLATLVEKIGKPYNMENLEILAAGRVVILATELGLQRSHFEGDSQTMIKALQMGAMFSLSFRLFS